MAGHRDSKGGDRMEERPNTRGTGLRIAIVGSGMGDRDSLTYGAMKEIQGADCLIGSKRVIESFPDVDKPKYLAITPVDIVECIRRHPYYAKFAVLMSGDTGFYSGAKGLQELLEQEMPDARVGVLPGLSSLQYFCARLKVPWQEVRVISLHGREQPVAPTVRRNAWVFVLTSGEETVNAVMQELWDSGLGQVRVAIGQNLGYSDESIQGWHPASMLRGGRRYAPLSVILLYNPAAGPEEYLGELPDESFSRGKVPMTKQEIRTVVLAKLHLQRDGILWDVGAGTGSVSIEAAMRMPEGWVYAVERSADAAEMIRRNQKKFGMFNMQVIRGTAPHALIELPAPHCVFVGGSGGAVAEIISLAQQRNPDVRVVVTAITLETLGRTVEAFQECGMEPVDIVQVMVSKSRKVGSSHMMMGGNPVYVLSAGGSRWVEGRRNRM